MIQKRSVRNEEDGLRRARERLDQRQNSVTKIVLWVYGVNSPTRRIMENEDLFVNVQENTWRRFTSFADNAAQKWEASNNLRPSKPP
ncbi:hypothetical protein AVEN_125030-1 [Araneus ventricosus]|uniref:Uncharacterized protein n=1 Tax=Araneus ventricosus TaxID=182803 RepID=A0A4Y2GZ28_ARAVE|nr:hypothetical protein AVEN_125030-1 [Araneus ventricosus]